MSRQRNDMASRNAAPVHFLYFRTFCHATEDEERAEAALRFYIQDAPIKRTIVHGYFGNPIIILETKVTEKNQIIEILTNIITANPIELLDSMLKTRIDDQCLWYFRFDKQEAYLASLVEGKQAEGAEAPPTMPTENEHSDEDPQDIASTSKAYWIVEHDDCIVMKAKIKAYPAKISIAKTIIQEYLQTFEGQKKV